MPSIRLLVGFFVLGLVVALGFAFTAIGLVGEAVALLAAIGLVVRGRRFFARPRAAKPPPPKTEAKQARELERTIQAGIAMHKPPTGPG